MAGPTRHDAALFAMRAAQQADTAARQRADLNAANRNLVRARSDRNRELERMSHLLAGEREMLSLQELVHRLIFEDR